MKLVSAYEITIKLTMKAATHPLSDRPDGLSPYDLQYDVCLL